MNALTASSTHLGLVANTPQGLALIDDARKLLKKTGLKLRIRGRNPDRQQFVRAGKVSHFEIAREVDHEFSTHFHLYLHNSNYMKRPTSEQTAFAKGILAAVQKIYTVHCPEVFVSQ